MLNHPFDSLQIRINIIQLLHPNSFFTTIHSKNRIQQNNPYKYEDGIALVIAQNTAQNMPRLLSANMKQSINSGLLLKIDRM